MRFTRAIAVLLVCAAAGFAQEHMADTLRSGIVAEDSKQDTRAAIQQYNAVLKQYAEARQTAATALFRMAECYRKQGDRGRAIEAYKRVMDEFSDQTKLAAQSRAVLSKTYRVDGQSDKAKFDELMAAGARLQEKAAQDREVYRLSIQKEIEIAREQLATAEQQYKAGAGPVTDVNEFKAKIAKLQTELAAFDAGIASAPNR
jgi:tetratricopeptide (TPR) repeat protein